MFLCIRFVCSPCARVTPSVLIRQTSVLWSAWNVGPVPFTGKHTSAYVLDSFESFHDEWEVSKRKANRNIETTHYKSPTQEYRNEADNIEEEKKHYDNKMLLNKSHRTQHTQAIFSTNLYDMKEVKTRSLNTEHRCHSEASQGCCCILRQVY